MFIVFRPKPFLQQQTQKWSSSLAVLVFPDWGGEKNPTQKESRSFGKGASVPFETLWCPVDHHHGMCGILLIGAAGNWAFSGTAGGDVPKSA